MRYFTKYIPADQKKKMAEIEEARIRERQQRAIENGRKLPPQE